MFRAHRGAWAVGLAVLLGIGLCMASGCASASYEGATRAAVKGSVTLDGNPLAYGTIAFAPVDDEGRRASGLIQSGSYSIAEKNGPNLGKYKVAILGYAKAPETGGEEEEDADEGNGNGNGDDDEDEDEGEEEEEQGASLGPQIVPAKYNTQTTLEVEITAGENTHDFQLTSE